MNKPITVGITGGIGSGKTLVSKIFSILGIPLYNADIRAKQLINSTLIESVSKAFGPESYVEGVLNRSFIAEQVFGNKEKLALLNSIVHPAVAIDFEHWVMQNKNAEYVLKEAALLVETGSYKQLDKLMVIIAPNKLRVERIRQRDVFRSNEEIENIIKSQTSDRAKVELADYVINNNESSLLIPQVLELDKKIRQHL